MTCKEKMWEVWNTKWNLQEEHCSLTELNPQWSLRHHQHFQRAYFGCIVYSSSSFFFHISAAQTPRDTVQQCKTFISHQNSCYYSPQMWLLGYVLCRAVRGNVLLVASSAFTCFKWSTFLSLWWFRRRVQSDCQSKTIFPSAGWLRRSDLDISMPHWNCRMARAIGLGPFIHSSSKAPTTALCLWFTTFTWSTCVRQS